MEKKDILCPDCEDNYINAARFNSFGKCVSCFRRETLARTKGIPYNKYKDLPQEEKDRLAHQREMNNLSAKRRRDKANGKVETKQEIKTKQANVTNKEVKDGITIRKNQIYTPDIIEHLKLIANETLSTSELLELLKSLYPDKPFNMSNFTNIIARHNIPHKASRSGRKPSEKATNEEPLNIQPEKSVIVATVQPKPIEEQLTDVVVPVTKEDVDDVNSTTTVSTQALLGKDEPERFAPIRAEIDNVLATKFKRLNCQVERDYSIDDYLNMVDMLIYLVENSGDIIKFRKNQYNIMNAYQSDTIHEFENAVADDGDTYLSDKMHIIRKYRRYYENDYKNIATLRPLRDMIDLEKLKQVQAALEKNKSNTDNAIFKPLVDTTMIDKYDWARPLDLNSAKSRISIANYNPQAFNKDTKPVTRIGLPQNTPPTNQLNAKMRKALKRFRVSCKVSGGGYGAFSNWYRDYECTSESTALAYAKNTLTQLATNRKGMIWTDLSCVQLNIDNTPATVVEKTATPS